LSHSPPLHFAAHNDHDRSYDDIRSLAHEPWSVNTTPLVVAIGIGLARSRDGIYWERTSSKPFLPVCHPGVFVDHDGKTCLFYQGNNDQGKTSKIGMLSLASRGK
jgi:hypothetical protein